MTQANGPRPVQGLVVACTGNGTIHHELQAALERASQAGVVVWRSTRCLFGRIICAEGSPDSADPSAWRAVSFSPVKARLALALAPCPVGWNARSKWGLSVTCFAPPEAESRCIPIWWGGRHATPEADRWHAQVCLRTISLRW